MKIVSVHDSKLEDSLWFDFDGVFDHQAARESEMEAFLQALEKYADGWMPDVVEGKRRRKYTRPAVWKALDEERRDKGTTIGLYRTAWPALDMTFRLWFPPLPPTLGIALHIKPLSVFADTERCRKFVEMVRAWASRYPVTHAMAHSSDDVNLELAPDFFRPDGSVNLRDDSKAIHQVYWLNVFGPDLVQKVGRERVLSTPAWRLEELPNGCVLLMTGPTVSDFASDEARLAQARAHAHLRPDLDFDTLLRALRERSAQLVPVEPRFPLDVAPLLSRIVDDAASYERPQQIAAFNAWQPPEPEEWAPAASALPPDVEDTQAALERYDTLAEHLVALLHTQAPSVFEASPESLTDIDFSFWHDNVPERRSPEALEALALPAVGAYLGEVLVRHLGGKWLPRQKREEAQVLVGSRVWFPFVRARHYLRSRQSLLDSSLTQLYRVAERHR